MVIAFRIELRRSLGFALGAVLVIVALGVLYGLSGPWGKTSVAWFRQWTALASWLRYMLLFLWPIAIGAGALQGLRDKRSGVLELMTTASRPRWQRVSQPLLALAAGLVTAWLALFLVGGVQVIGATSYFSWDWLPVLLVGALALIAGAWLGAALGRLVPSALTPPVLAVSALVLLALIVTAAEPAAATAGAVPRWFGVLSPALPTPQDVFTVVDGRMTGAQLAWFAGMAATAFLVLAAASVRERLLAVLPVLLGAAVAVPLYPADVTTVDKSAIELVCSDTVCVRKIHEHELAALTGPGQEALRLLAKLPDPPKSIVEDEVSRAHQGRGAESTDVVRMDLDQMGFFRRDKTPTADELTLRLVAGAGTRTCFRPSLSGGPGAIRERAAQAVSAAWVFGKLQPLPSANWAESATAKFAEPAWAKLRTLPADEQLARIQAMRTVAASCEGDPLGELTR
ncbi:hypothetical protein [Amycolatopsis sp. NPDC059657]|uniref:hypothetical protein n=1 Tax=Amycolatopsis sp. NPDC059657 TaxID=3346899 RepID=UPI0036704E91